MNHPKKSIDHAQPEMNGGIDQFLAAGDRLKSDPTFTKGYEKLAKEGANMMVAMADIKRVTIPKANPFLTGERQEADQTDAILHAVHEYFLLDEEAKAKPSAHDLEEATFHPSSGVFGRLLIMLAEDEDYSRSYQALKLIEGEFRSMFEVEEPSLALISTASPSTDIELYNNTLSLREKIKGVLERMKWGVLLTIALVFKLKQTRELVAALLQNIDISASRRSSVDKPSSNHELDLVSKAVGGNLSDDERKKLQQMYVEMAPIKGMVGAFQCVLAQDMMEKRGKDPDDKRTQKLLPLLTAEGFTRCMAVAKSEKGEAIPSLFATLPRAFEVNCADLEPVRNVESKYLLEPKPIKHDELLGIQNYGSDRFVRYGINSYSFFTINEDYGRFEEHFKFTIKKWTRIDQKLYVEQGGTICRHHISTGITGGHPSPYAELRDMVVMYDKPFDDWDLESANNTEATFAVLFVKIGDNYYRVKSNQVDGKKVFVE